MKQYCLAMMVFVLIIRTAYADNGDQSVPEPLTLKQAEKIALKNHPDILSARYSTKAAAEGVNDARSAYWPQVTGNAVRTFDDRGTVIAASGGLTSSSVIERGSLGLGLSQLLTDFGKTSNLIASSKLAFESQKDQADFVRDTVLLNVITAYYDLLRSRSLLQVAKDALQTRAALLDQVSALRRSKMKSDLDVSIAQSAVADANLLVLKAHSGLDDAQAALSEALGLREFRTFDPVDNASIAPPPSQVGLLVSQALEENPQIAASQAHAAALQKAAAAARDAKFPTISAVGFAGGTPYRVSDQPMDQRYEAAGILVSVPLFTGGRITAQAKEAKDIALAAQEDLTARMNQLQRDVRIAYDNAQTAYKNIEVTSELLRNTRESLELTQASYQLGRSSIVDLNEAQLADTQAAIAKANADYEYLIQQAILDYRLGNLDHGL